VLNGRLPVLLALGAWLAIAGVPLAALIVMAAAGAVLPGAALLAMVLISVAAMVLVAAWLSDLALLRRALRLAAAEDRATLATLVNAASLPQTRLLANDIERLSRTLADRAALVGRLLKADEVIVESLPDPLIVLGDDRAVRRANRAARQVFGGDMPAVLRQPGLRGAIDRAYAQGINQQVDLTLASPVARDVQAVVIPLDPPLADGGRAIIQLSDRTRDRAVERMRADFVANASHELRTPLASLMGFIETLRGPARDDPPAQARFLGIMAEQADRMNRLIDDLLSLSRVELTEHQTPSAKIDLGGLVERMAAEIEPRALARQMELVQDLAPNLPPILGDEDQLAQILQNLLDNAVKYGRDGGHITVSVQRPDGRRWPARPGLVLTVADDGHGIAKRHLPRLTERFYRVDKGRSRAVGGTGLGLAIVKHIVNRHRGQLVIESEEEQGATFYIWLPLAPG
jgi:two-component system phosphate regulon sensor histidine kinase PhoR